MRFVHGCSSSRCTWGDFGALGAWTASLPEESKALLIRAGFRPDQPELRARGMPCVAEEARGAWRLVSRGSPGG